MRRSSRYLPVVIAVVTAVLLVVVNMEIISAQDNTFVTIDAPEQVVSGGDFTARLNITNVENLDTCEIDVNYDPSVIEVIGPEGAALGVSPGLVDTYQMQVPMWMFRPSGVQGTVKILGNIPGVAGASGDGYLCEIHFHVIGSSGDTTEIMFVGGFLGDNMGEEIPSVIWQRDSVTVVGGTVVPVPTPTPTVVLTSTPPPTSQPPTTTPPVTVTRTPAPTVSPTPEPGITQTPGATQTPAGTSTPAGTATPSASPSPAASPTAVGTVSTATPAASPEPTGTPVPVEDDDDSGTNTWYIIAPVVALVLIGGWVYLLQRRRKPRV